MPPNGYAAHLPARRNPRLRQRGLARGYRVLARLALVGRLLELVRRRDG